MHLQQSSIAITANKYLGSVGFNDSNASFTLDNQALHISLPKIFLPLSIKMKI